MHEKTLTAANPLPVEDTSATFSNGTEENNLDSLVRMCWGQLNRIHTVKKKELERLSRKSSSSVKLRDVQEQLALVEEACVTKDSKGKAHIWPVLPVGNEGEMWFPCLSLFPFLREFDSVVRQQINFDTFHKLGELAFKSMQQRMEQQCYKDRLFPLFASCFGKFSDTTITEVYALLLIKWSTYEKKTWKGRGKD